jgi:protein TonB
MEANKILSADILDILFEGKNKDYGAYELRKTYNGRIVRALIVTAAVALLALLGSVLASNNDSGPKKKNKQQEVNLQDLKEEEKKVEPPPPPPPPPPKPPQVEMKQFTPPIIKKDEDVVKPPPPVEELKDTKIAEVNQEGVKETDVPTPVVIDEGKKIVEEKKEDDENKIFDKVEIEASFPGGEVKWRQYLEKTLQPNTPVDNGAPADKYTVYVQFIVDKEGNISDVHALTNHGYGMEAEAVRVIKAGPKWTPAIQNGRQVKAYRKQPITFIVTGDE